MQTVTPLFSRLGKCTTCGQITLCAGLLLWGAWRLKGHAPVEHNFELAEAAFAAQIDWRYLDRQAGPQGMPPDDPPALSAIMELNRYMRRALNLKKYWHSYYTPVAETFHASHVVRHIVPEAQKKAFAEWFEAVIDRVLAAASKPMEEFRRKDQFGSIDEWQAFVAPHRGNPLSLAILNPIADFDLEMGGKQVQQFLANLDWKANRYLNSPDAMRKLGFEGAPY